MLTDARALRKLERVQRRYADLRFEKVADVEVEFWECREHYRSEPTARDGAKWRRARPGTRWGGNWVTAWFRGDVVVPERCGGRKLFVRARTGGETLFFADGRARGVFDGNHPVVLLTRRAEAGRRHHLAFEAYSGHTFPGCAPQEARPPVRRRSRVFQGVEVVVEREDVSAFVFDLAVLLRLMKALDENSLRRNRIAAALGEVYRVVEALPEGRVEGTWRPRLAKARRLMRPLLECRNGPTAPYIGLIGHSHLDTAWLWPLAETWRKAARTFASALTLMELYPEMTFIQSAPCHAWVVRAEYPELFERIRRAVKKGRWEPNGAMWVEPDCNIPSGESFVRQLLLGQGATEEMFGYRADTLWLPDVFGYSAALPQLLREAGVEFFCTTKMSWNDTTRFPYDTFIWQGIDGSRVIAHYNATHCWPDPQTLIEQWNWVQHKDVQDRRLCAFGFGDGGGGPMMEMCEVARRVRDLEGCPRTGYTTVSDFMRGVRDEVRNLPTWVGELYLELHRGTLTSVARVKRGNRKCELALRDAETLWATAAVGGADYPRERLRELWRTLLTNQFHDILPGSSIAEVNDEAVATLDRVLDEARGLARDAAAAMAGEPGQRPARLLVANTLNWPRGGEIALEGVPEGMVPAGEGIAAQWVEDVEGRQRLFAAGLDVPPLGMRVVELAAGKARGDSPFRVRGSVVETPYARVRFDKWGRIASFVDRATGRQVVGAGGALNTLLLGEDVPEAWDNWDIDSDQRQKMEPQLALLASEVVAKGPLQLRVRNRYAIGERSRLTQDIVFHSTTAQVDFETVVEWDERHRLLKAAFPLAILAETARHEIQFGHVERPTHQNQAADRARFEVCAHKWTDISDNGFGVAVLNDCKYGVSVIGGEVGLSLLKSGTHPDPRGDRGRHVFTYALLPHAGGFSVEAVVRPAYELNVEPVAAPAGPRARDRDGLVEVDAPNVVIEAIKWAERGEALIVRLYEAGKKATRCRVRFRAPVRAVARANILEEPQRPLSLRGGRVSLALRPFEVATLRCELHSGRIRRASRAGLGRE